jgi:peptidoglycan/LPS O-acetylase OafA/YrhL
VYKSLQSCRAIAALLVFMYHLGATFSLEKYFGTLLFYKPFSFGDSGVEFFFVLSGFIIHNAHRKDVFNGRVFLSFLKKRVIRIYPVYWIIFSLIYFGSLFLPQIGSLEAMSMQEVVQSFFLIPCHLSGVNGTGAPVLVVAWSLHYEIVFYSIVGFFIVGRMGAACILIIILTSCFLNHRGFGLEYPFSHIANHYMLLFWMGMMMSYFNQLRVLKTWVSVIIAVSGFLLFLTVALDQVFWLGLYHKLQTIMFGVSCSLIIFGLSNSERGGFEIGGHTFLQVLGNASYSLYLLHFPLLSLLCKVCVLLGINDKGLLVTSIAYAFILFFCIYISIKFHYLIEMPVTKWLRRKFL